MFKELNKLKIKENIFKKDLMIILKSLAKTISIHDLIMATVFLREDGKYVQKSYREGFLEIYIKYFILRIKDVKEDETEYIESIEKEELSGAIDLLEFQFNNEVLYTNETEKFPLIYMIICLYTTFILEEPIHPVGTPFPGSLKVSYENGTYFCPVKEKQSDNPYAVCKLCKAEQEDF